MRTHNIFIALGLAAFAAAAVVLLQQEPPRENSASPPRPSTGAPRAGVAPLDPSETLRDSLIDLSGLFGAVRSSPDSARRYHETRRSIVERGPDQVPALSKLLSEDADLSVRLMALSLLQAIGGTASLEALDRAHRDPGMNETLRVAAAEAIAAIEGADPEPVLLRILNDGPGRDVAASELGRRRSSHAVPALSGALADEGNLSLACHAATALGRIGEAASREALERGQAAARSPVLLRSIQQALHFSKESP